MKTSCSCLHSWHSASLSVKRALCVLDISTPAVFQEIACIKTAYTDICSHTFLAQPHFKIRQGPLPSHPATGPNISLQTYLYQIIYITRDSIYVYFYTILSIHPVVQWSSSFAHLSLAALTDAFCEQVNFESLVLLSSIHRPSWPSTSFTGTDITISLWDGCALLVEMFLDWIQSEWIAMTCLLLVLGFGGEEILQAFRARRVRWPHASDLLRFETRKGCPESLSSWCLVAASLLWLRLAWVQVRVCQFEFGDEVARTIFGFGYGKLVSSWVVHLLRSFDQDCLKCILHSDRGYCNSYSWLMFRTP